MFGLWDSRIRPCAKCCLSFWKQHNRAMHLTASLASGRHHYEVLGLKPNATLSEIKEAFVKISKEIHPDMNPSNPANHDKFVQLNEAYSILSKVQSRRQYDTSLMAQIMNERNRPSAVNSHSHWPDAQANPQNPQYSEEQMFWDETIWHMRDRTQDAEAYYEEDSYYGVKGIQRVSNSIIVTGCLIFMIIGFAGFYARYRFSSEVSKKAQDKLHNENVQHLEKARSNARLRGTEKQLELLHAEVKARAESIAKINR